MYHIIRRLIICEECGGVIRHTTVRDKDWPDPLCLDCRDPGYRKKMGAIPTPTRKPDFELSNYYQDNSCDNMVRIYEERSKSIMDG